MEQMINRVVKAFILLLSIMIVGVGSEDFSAIVSASSANYFD